VDATPWGQFDDIGLGDPDELDRLLAEMRRNTTLAPAPLLRADDDSSDDDG
jgi:hypothetical protein